MRVRDQIRSDLFRYCGKADFLGFAKSYLLNRGFNYMFWFRLAHAKNPAISGFAGLVLRIKQNLYGIIIPKGTEVGCGLYIGHNGPCIVHPTARIGNNVNISQYVTIGANLGKAAIVGDNVYIGPNSVLVENVIVGDNVTIGAGSVVVRSLPACSTAAGNPARVLNQNNPGRFINKRWRSES